MDVQQIEANENEHVLAVFDGLLPMVRHFFYVMILYSYAVFCLYWYIIDILLMHEYASEGF